MSVFVSVIVPTYREADNLPVLVPRVAAALRQANLDGEILVIDDDSRDGTDKVCADLAAAHPVRLVVRTGERGLSGAVLHGMRLAKGDVFVVMDADLSHPPEKIPELVAALRDGDTDFVIGSRYVQGGGTAGGWGLFRWLNSKAATLLARPLTSASDPMAGFFALRRASFEAAAPLDPIGYKIGLELMVKGGCKNVREVPIHFENRLHGSSKLSLREQVNYLRHLKRLYEFKYGILARLVAFLFVGATGMLVDLAAFALLLGLLPLAAARAGAIGVAMTWNFWLNRRFTFSHARSQPLLPQYALFCLSCGVGAAVNWSISVGLTTWFDLFAARPLLAAAVGIVVGTGFNFVLCDNAVFQRTARAEPVLGRR